MILGLIERLQGMMAMIIEMVIWAMGPLSVIIGRDLFIIVHVMFDYVLNVGMHPL